MTRSLRKISSATIAVILLVAFMVGCSGKASPTPTSAPTSAPAAKPPTSAPVPTPVASTPVPKPTESKPASPTAAPVTLRLNYVSPQGAARGEGMQWFLDEVGRRSNGLIKVQPYWAASLLQGKETLEGVQKGTVDMGEATISTYSEKLSLFSYTQAVPFHSSDTKAMAEGIWKLYDQIPAFSKQLESYNQKAVFLIPQETLQLVFAKKPVKTLADMKGLKVRTSGKEYSLFVATGDSTPVTIVAAEVFDALQRGTVDGMLVSIDAVIRYSWNDVSKYVFVIDYGATLNGVVSINSSTWAKLDPSLQKIIRDVGRETTALLGQKLNDQGDQNIKGLQGKGMQFYTISAGERSQWAQKPSIQAIVDNWVKDQEAKGLAGRQIMDAFLAQEGRK